VNATTITDYRAKASDPGEARIILLVDNVGAFRQAYEGSADRQRILDTFTSVASDGRGVGVHVVATAGERVAISTSLSSSIQRRLVMRMATEDDYSLLGVPADVLDPSSPRGRAIDDGQEIQIAVLGSDRDDASQATEIRKLATALRATGMAEAPKIVSLSSAISLSELAPIHGEVVVGVQSSSLQPVGVAPRGAFVVTGPPGSGRTTAVSTMVASAKRLSPGVELHYLGVRRSPLVAAFAWTSTSVTPEDVGAQAQRLADQISSSPTESLAFAIVIEGASEFSNSAAETGLQALVKACNTEGQWLIVEGEVSTLRSTTGFLGLVRGGRRGLALQPDQDTGSALFSTPFPRTNRAEFPEGRGFLVGSGKVALVQVALPPDALG
jgi:S-DNA-T family DNA segregation ATPase FtsK/SpoIIIE